jgi:hypothetical protein
MSHRFLVEEHPEEKKSLGKPRCRWEINIKTDLKEIICKTPDWFVCFKTGTSGYLL